MLPFPKITMNERFTETEIPVITVYEDEIEDEIIEVDDKYIPQLSFEERESIMDIVGISPNHIQSNGTMHKSPYAGLAELFDNAIDSGATVVKFEYKKAAGEHGNYLIVSDNGTGMNRVEALNMILLGHSNKRYDTKTIGQFGNGLKSGSIRLGETVLVSTKKDHVYTLLLLSIKYMLHSSARQCAVPIVSFDVKGDAWKPVAFAGEHPEKHMHALDRVFEHTPIKTLAELKAYLLMTIPGKSGTAVLVASLKRVFKSGDGESHMYELRTAIGGDFLAFTGDSGENKKDKESNHGRKEKPQYLADYLAVLYLQPKAAIYLGDRRVNTSDPIRALLDPRCASLSKKDVDILAEKQRENLTVERTKLTVAKMELEKTLSKYSGYLADAGEKSSDKWQGIRKEQRMKQKEISENERKKAEITSQIESLGDKGVDEIKVVFGMDLIDREPRVVFYTNGRRICTKPLIDDKKEKNKDKFKDYIGVVCIVDIPSTLLHTNCSREGYESHAEVNLIMTSLKKIAKRYFEYADPKYKTEAFWTSLGYYANPIVTDICSPAGLLAARKMIGIRKQCSICRQFRAVTVEGDVKDHICALFQPEQEYVCPIDPTTNQCELKSKTELGAEEIQEFTTIGLVPTKYGEVLKEKEKKKPMNRSRVSDHEDTPPTKRISADPITEAYAIAMGHRGAQLKSSPPRSASSSPKRAPAASARKRTRPSVKYVEQSDDEGSGSHVSPAVACGRMQVADIQVRSRPQRSERNGKKMILPTVSDQESDDDDADSEGSVLSDFSDKAEALEAKRRLEKKKSERVRCKSFSQEKVLDMYVNTRVKLHEAEDNLRALGKMLKKKGVEERMRILEQLCGLDGADEPREIISNIVKKNGKKSKA